MHRRAVPLVPRETVAGKLRIQLDHHLVSRHFGEDGRARNRERELIAVDDGLLRQRERGQGRPAGRPCKCVNQQRVRRERERGNRALHRETRRGDDAERVNLFARRQPGRTRERGSADWGNERFALRGGEEFGIARAGEIAQRGLRPPLFDVVDPAIFAWATDARQNHRARDDGTCPRAAPGFVNAGDVRESARPKSVFKLESGGDSH